MRRGVFPWLEQCQWHGSEVWGEGKVRYWKQIFQMLALHGQREGQSLAGDLESKESFTWFSVSG